MQHSITKPEFQNSQEGHIDQPEKMTIWTFVTTYPFLTAVFGAFCVDFFTPYLIWKAGFPSAVRFLSDAIIAMILALVFTRMLAFNKIPRIVLLLFGVSIIWTVVALFEGQGLVGTIWGWWVMFRYPMIGLFIYLQPSWPKNIRINYMNACVWLLTANTLLQIIQYAGGQRADDHLAGFFGRHGVMPLFFFAILIICYALGYWIAYGNWKILLFTIVLGAVASGLGEMKVFPVALVLVGLLSLGLQLLEGTQVQRIFFFLLLFSIIFPAFAAFYNVVVADARGTKRIEEYLDADTADEYLNATYTENSGTYFYLGRSFALELGWKTIQRDRTTFLFGMGLGTRAESKTLGVAGTALTRGDYGLNSGTSLLVMMQELGVVGLSIFIFFLLWVVVKLWMDAQRNPDSLTNPLRYGAILFALCWPFWLYYGQVWVISVIMILFWGTLGYLLRPEIKDYQVDELSIE
ncbi:MAG: hypothetical protein DWQ04_08065 [Chloroflexi bacterium]|nr:MAG: hypothetical protein DWQ04_08065 [Chloroflexota bacterium]